MTQPYPTDDFSSESVCSSNQAADKGTLPTLDALTHWVVQDLPGDAQRYTLDHYLRRGNEYYEHFLTKGRSSDLDSALQAYRQAVTLDSQGVEGYQGLLKVLIESSIHSRDHALGPVYAEKLSSLDPLNPWPYVYHGHCAAQGSTWDLAIAHYTKAFQKSGYIFPRVALALSSCHWGAAREKNSIFDRVSHGVQGCFYLVAGILTLPLERRGWLLIRSLCFQELAEYAVHLSVFALRKMRRLPQAVQLLEWAMEKEIQSSRLYLQLGDLYMGMKRPAEAIPYYQQALDEGTGQNPVSVSEQTSMMKKLADAYTQSHQKEMAIKTHEKIVQLNPMEFQLVYGLAQMCLDHKAFIRALYYFRESQRLSPKNPYIQSHLGYIMFKLEDYDGAINAYQSAIQLGEDPVWIATVAQTLGTLYYKVNHDVEAALGMYQLAAKYDPSNLSVRTSLVDLYTEQGDVEAAVQVYEDIVQQNHSNADCLTYFGYLLWQSNRNEEAIVAYQKALDIDGTNVIAYNNLGVIYLDDYGVWDEALALFEQALEHKPDYTMACFNKGRALELMGHPTEAAQSYAMAKRLNQMSPELSDEEIEERIQGLFQT